MYKRQYEKPDKRGKVLVCSQDQFCEEAVKNVEAELGKMDPVSNRVFVPVISQN